jgi:hypothetical protein
MFEIFPFSVLLLFLDHFKNFPFLVAGFTCLVFLAFLIRPLTFFSVLASSCEKEIYVKSAKEGFNTGGVALAAKKGFTRGVALATHIPKIIATISFILY